MTMLRRLWDHPLLLLPLPPLFWAGNLVLGRALAGAFPPVSLAVGRWLVRRRPADLDPLVFLAATMAAGVLVLLPFWMWELARGATIPTAPAALAAVLYIGVFASFLAFVIWNRCVAALGPSVTGASFHLVALFTAVLAYLLGEPVHPFHVVGPH